ncbi:MAG: transglutaminase-like putative cysteine protease [Arcticibacterium sp.]|jgi:transglutaminase-like putative cysteine protease
MLLYCSFLIFINGISAQLKPTETYETYREKFPEESGIIFDYQRVITVKKKGDSLDIQTSQFKEILILDKPSRWVKEKVFSSSFSKVDEIEAYTLLPNKRKYKKIPVEEFKRSFDKDTYVFFDDTEVINFNFPQLVEGAKIVTSQNWTSSDPHVIGSFYFGSYVPVLHASFKVIVEEGIEIIHGLKNDSLANIKFTQDILKDGSKVYTYEAFDLPKISYEDNSPAFGYLSPSAYMLIANYKDTNNKEISILSSLGDLHTWYRTFIDNMEVDSSLHELAKNIVNDDDIVLEKVRKIFYWVQNNIKYIAFEDGMRGFIPHQADYVMEKRYGDCKDMTSILVGLLKSEGIDANFTWIGTRDIPFKYTEIPSPIVDNHMIASVEIEGRTYFLDATGSYSPLGFPTSMIQGKESLISLGENFEIKNVPVIAKEESQMNDTTTIWLEDDVLYGEGQVTLSGLAKVANTYQLIQKTSKGEDGYVRRLLSRGNNKFLVDDYQVSNVDNLDKPIKIKYSYNVADYYKTINNEIYINLCLDRSLINQSIKDRDTPLKNEYKFISSSHTKLKIPEGYQLQYKPKGGEFNTPQFGFEIAFDSGEPNSVTFISSIYINYLNLHPLSFEEWNKMIDEYAKLTRRTIVLEKI